jgi:hypothetical protein
VSTASIQTGLQRLHRTALPYSFSVEQNPSRPPNFTHGRLHLGLGPLLPFPTPNLKNILSRNKQSTRWENGAVDIFYNANTNFTNSNNSPASLASSGPQLSSTTGRVNPNQQILRRCW